MQPFPDAMLGADRSGSDPATVTVLVSRGSLRLAFVAAMQLLPARHRAILILRDVLDLSPGEVAEALEMKPAAVNRALRRARARLDAVLEDQVDEHLDPSRRALVHRFNSQRWISTSRSNFRSMPLYPLSQYHVRGLNRRRMESLLE